MKKNLDKANFTEGLKRVASVIENIPNYDEMLGARLAEINFHSGESTEVNNLNIQEALKFISSRLKKRGIKQYDFNSEFNCLCFVKTRNNIVEFELFKSIVNINTKIKIINLATEVPVKFKIDRERFFDIISNVCLLLKDYYTNKPPTPGIIYQSLQYTCAYLDFWFSLNEYSNLQGKIHFTANDHSPIPVALTMNCINRRMGTVYFQHAAVTESFPDLIFDISVLHNRQSLTTYTMGKKKTGSKNFILSRHLIDNPELILTKLNLSKNRSSHEIVIYLTAVINNIDLIDFVHILESIDYIKDIYIKFHPSTNIEIKEFLASKIKFKVLDRVPEFEHVAIVGNSSVLLELISKGIPCLNYFDLDCIDSDYYGFVKAGISQKLVNTKDLKSALLSITYDSAFLEKASNFNPSFIPGYSQEYKVDVRKISSYIQLLLNIENKTALENFLNVQFERILFSEEESIKNISNKDFHDLGFNIVNLILYLEDLFKKRDERLISLFNRATLSRSNNLIYTWLQLYKIEWTGFKPDKVAIESFFANIMTIESIVGKRAYRILENKLLNVLIRYALVEYISLFFSSSNYINLSNLHINRRIALLKLLLNNNGSIGIDIDSLYYNLSSYHQLKMEVQGKPQDSKNPKTHYKTESNFLRYAHSKISAEFNQLIVPVYDKLRYKMQFMDVLHNSEVKDRIKSLIIDKIKHREPFCFIRLSDGEGYIFSNTEGYMNIDDIKNRERHWWGCELDVTLRNEIIEELKKVVNRADILGIPTIYRFIRDSTEKSDTFLNYIQGRGMYNVLRGVYSSESLNTHCLFGSDKMNLALFSNKNDFIDLMKFSSHIVFITSVRKEVLNNIINPAGEYSIDVIELPTHYKTSGNDLYINQGKPLPFVYKEIIEKIDQVVNKGSTVFVAGGVIGKIFIGRAKEKGAIAIDAGSAMDTLVGAGIHSLY